MTLKGVARWGRAWLAVVMLAVLPGTAGAMQQASAGDAQRPTPTVNVAGELAPIATNVDRAALLMPAWESGPPGSIPASNAPDVVGAFRFMCSAGHLGYDDPIVFPGQPGKSHLHQFFGNSRTDAYSTYDTLRTSGDSSCMNALNRSAYWIPAMLDGRGHVIRPDNVAIYYKRIPQSSPNCQIQAKRCAAVPRGLRYVFGYDMLSRKAGGGYWNCDGPGAKPGNFPTIVAAAAVCPVGAKLGAHLDAPDCWDGKRLDSANHRDHMTYAGYGNTGVLRCPSTHPVLIPAFFLHAWYTVDDSLHRDGTPSWHLSSDEMPGMMMPPGSTLHGDWFGAWDDTTLETWTAHCIDRMLNCSGGDLGNGTQLRERKPFSWTANPRLVAVPPRPAVAEAQPVRSTQ